MNIKPNLTVVSDHSKSTDDELFQIALTLNPKLTQEQFQKMLGKPELVQKLNAILVQNEAAEAAQKAAEEQKVIDTMAAALVKQANVILHPVTPKGPVENLTIQKIAEIIPAQPPTQAERIEKLKQKYGTKVPGKIFNHYTHEFAMGLRGAMIGVKIRFEEDLKRIADNEEMRVAYKNRCDSLQRFIDVLTEIVKVGYQIDPNDKKNHATPQIFNQILALNQTDPRLFEHCKLPETKAEREVREKQEKERAAAEELKKALELKEREKAITSLIEKMMTVGHFQKMPADGVRRIAERVARKFSGSTPESKLKQASREKSGGEVKLENRQLGLALGMAGGFNADELKALFPNAKQKKEKRQKR